MHNYYDIDGNAYPIPNSASEINNDSAVSGSKVDDALETNASAIGTLSDLTTTTKGSLVAAINETFSNSESAGNQIYIGSETPTDNDVKMWIDLSDSNGGDSSNGSYVSSINGMTGDVTLDIPSINGLASETYVQNALANYQPSTGEYELIETYTVEEATAQIDFTQTPNGTAYAFNSILTIIDLPEGSYDNAAYYSIIYFGDYAISLYSSISPSASYKKRGMFEFENKKGRINASCTGFSNLYGAGDYAYSEGSSTKTCADFRAAQPITKLRVKSNQSLPVGTIIRIYGVM